MFPAVGRVIERLHVEGDGYVRETAAIGLLEGIQNAWSRGKMIHVRRMTETHAPPAPPTIRDPFAAARQGSRIESPEQRDLLYLPLRAAFRRALERARADTHFGCQPDDAMMASIGPGYCSIRSYTGIRCMQLCANRPPVAAIFLACA